MTNEQIQALKAAADATQATEWEFHERYSLSHAGGGYVSINGVEAIWCLNKAVGGMAHSKDVLRYIAAANPAVILSLLAERDADNALIAVYSDAYKEAAHEVSVNWEAATALAEENTELKRRIAELEARTLTMKLPPSIDCSNAHFAIRAGRISYRDEVIKELESACAAAGIKLDVVE